MQTHGCTGLILNKYTRESDSLLHSKNYLHLGIGVADLMAWSKDIRKGSDNEVPFLIERDGMLCYYILVLYNESWTQDSSIRMYRYAVSLGETICTLPGWYMLVFCSAMYSSMEASVYNQSRWSNPQYIPSYNDSCRKATTYIASDIPTYCQIRYWAACVPFVIGNWDGLSSLKSLEDSLGHLVPWGISVRIGIIHHLNSLVLFERASFQSECSVR